MAGADDQLGVGGGLPPMGPVGGPGFEAEEKALRKGKGRMLAAMIAAVVAVVVGLGFYLSSGDDEAYTKFGQNINGYDQQYFDQFWGCALQGTNLRDVRSDRDLRTQINRRVVNGKQRYAAQVRDRCLRKLAEFGPKLEALLPPDDLRAHVRTLADANRDLRSAWSDFIAHVEGLEDGYDADAASDLLGRIAKAWYDYRRGLAALNDDLRARLGRAS